MGIFKSKKNSAPSDVTSILDDIDNEDFSAGAYPEDDYDSFDTDEDYLGLSDIDEDIEKDSLKKADQEHSQRMRKIALFGIPLALVFILVIFFTVFGGSDDTAPQGNDNGVDSSIQGDGNGVLVNEQVGMEYNGKDNGNPINGTGAILAFDYAYYVDRDGEKARSLFNPDATNYDSHLIQNHIDQVPNGTTYNLSVIPTEIGRTYDVTLTLMLPGADPVSYKQKFETMEVDGKFFVKEFTSTREE